MTCRFASRDRASSPATFRPASSSSCLVVAVTIPRRIVAAAANLPVEKHHPHVAKHTTGTLLARAGASAFLVRQHLGHRSISSSQMYCSVFDRDASAAARSAFMQAF